MRILRVDQRYFIVDTQRDYEDVALKLLNELRIMKKGLLKSDLYDFIVKITEDMDGEMAVSMVPRLYDAEVIRPETL